jgi:tetratricopeptide (TPR) repeat protein
MLRNTEPVGVNGNFPDEHEERKKFYKNSLDLFLLMIKQEPKNPPAWGHIGLLLYELGRFDESLEYFAKINDIEPDNAVALDARGFVEMERGDFAAAASHFEKVIQLSPKRHDVAADLALCLYHLKRFDDLKAILEKSVGKKMGVKEHYLLGKTADAEGEESADHYRRSLELYQSPSGPVREAQYATLNAMRGVAYSLLNDEPPHQDTKLLMDPLVEATRRANLTDPDRMILSAFDLTFKTRGDFIKEIKDYIGKLHE